MKHQWNNGDRCIACGLTRSGYSGGRTGRTVYRTAYGTTLARTGECGAAARIVERVQRFRRRLHAYREMCNEAGLLPREEDVELLLDDWAYSMPDPADDPSAPLAQFIAPGAEPTPKEET